MDYILLVISIQFKRHFDLVQKVIISSIIQKKLDKTRLRAKNGTKA